MYRIYEVKLLSFYDKAMLRLYILISACRRSHLKMLTLL